MAMIPSSHLVENQKLTAQGYVDLIEIITIEDGTIRFKNNEKTTWQGKLFESLSYTLNNVEKSASDKSNRPQITISNPDSLFSSFVVNGALEKATLNQYRVLYKDLIEDKNIYQLRTWFVGRVALLKRDAITLELRSLIDGPNFKIPARSYIPPEFPMVTIG